MNFYILQKDWKKVIDYAQASYDEFKSEIGGFMIAKRDKDGDIIVSSPEILKQEVTGSTTIMDKMSIADYYVKSAQAHGTDIRFIWWHSHADMGAFWSGTDTETMKEYSKGDWSAFLVVNIREEYKFRICVWNPIEAYKDTELNIINAKPKVISKTIKDSVSKLCSKPVTAITTNNKKWDTGEQTSLYNQGYGYYGYDYYKDIPSHKVYNELKDDSLFNTTVDHITNMNDLYTEGLFTFKDWFNEVKSWNKKLKEKKASFSISEFTENELHLECGFYTSYNPLNMLIFESDNEQNIKV